MFILHKLITSGLDRCVQAQSRSSRFIFVASRMSLAGSPIDECVQKCMINDGRVSMHLEMEEIEERTWEKGPIT